MNTRCEPMFLMAVLLITCLFEPQVPELPSSRPPLSQFSGANCLQKVKLYTPKWEVGMVKEKCITLEANRHGSKFQVSSVALANQKVPLNFLLLVGIWEYYGLLKTKSEVTN